MSEHQFTAAAERLRVVVDRADNPPCGLAVGDTFEVVGPNLVTGGRELCSTALAAVAPLVAARQYPLPVDDWLVRKPYFSCPHVADQVVMRLEAVVDDASQVGEQ